MLLLSKTIVSLLVMQQITKCLAKKPNIVLIIGDDMGWNDVGFHGNNALKTPNIDALAYNGIILNKHYSLPTCTPSRAALLTGNYPIRIGYQGFPIYPGENRFLPELPTLPEQLKTLGYTTHLVGKWHLGAGHRNNTPLNRGFDTYFGHWNGYIGYFNYKSQAMGLTGTDIHDGHEPATSYVGRYCTDIYTEKAEEVIRNRSRDGPFFLMVSHHAAHTGWDNEELAVKNVLETVMEFPHIKDHRRKLYAGIMKSFDESVGRIVKTLGEQNVLDNTIVAVFADNGGPTVGTMGNTASNWPLRGMKMSVNEGGVRTFSAVWSARFANNGIVRDDLFHITDWMPTFYSAAGGNVSSMGRIDGVDQWRSLVDNGPSARDDLLVNIDEKLGEEAIIGHNGRYKLLAVREFKAANEYHSRSREDETAYYDVGNVLESMANNELRKVAPSLTYDRIESVRRRATIADCRIEKPIANLTFALFDLERDPCETTDMAEGNAIVVDYLRGRLETYRDEAVPQQSFGVDPCANPDYYDNNWDTWLSNPIADCNAHTIKS